jgi:hypothetical protein
MFSMPPPSRLKTVCRFERPAVTRAAHPSRSLIIKLKASKPAAAADNPDAFGQRKSSPPCARNSFDQPQDWRTGREHGGGDDLGQQMRIVALAVDEHTTRLDQIEKQLHPTA